MNQVERAIDLLAEMIAKKKRDGDAARLEGSGRQALLGEIGGLELASKLLASMKNFPPGIAQARGDEKLDDFLVGLIEDVIDAGAGFPLRIEKKEDIYYIIQDLPPDSMYGYYQADPGKIAQARIDELTDALEERGEAVVEYVELVDGLAEDMTKLLHGREVLRHGVRDGLWEIVGRFDIDEKIRSYAIRMAANRRLDMLRILPRGALDERTIQNIESEKDLEAVNDGDGFGERVDVEIVLSHEENSHTVEFIEAEIGGRSIGIEWSDREDGFSCLRIPTLRGLIGASSIVCPQDDEKSVEPPFPPLEDEDLPGVSDAEISDMVKGDDAENENEDIEEEDIEEEVIQYDREDLTEEVVKGVVDTVLRAAAEGLDDEDDADDLELGEE